MDICHNNPKKSSTAKMNKHKSSGYSLFTHCLFDSTKNSLIVIEVKIVLMMTIKNIKRLEIIVIALESIEELIIIFAI